MDYNFLDVIILRRSQPEIIDSGRIFREIEPACANALPVHQVLFIKQLTIGICKNQFSVDEQITCNFQIYHALCRVGVSIYLNA